MAFFDADEPANNSKLKELELLVDKKVNVYKKKDILYYEKDDTVLGVAGVLKEKDNGAIKGTVIAVAVRDSEDDPVWDVSNIHYDANKLEDQLRDGKYEKISAKMFKKKDTIWGSHFDDELYGFKGDDQLDGWRGNDVLYGDKGRDTLKGNIGDDRLVGGAGKDLLQGGADADTFVFDQELKSNNVDTIKNFDLSQDTIELKKKIFSEFDKGKLSADQFTVGKNPDGDEAQILYLKSKGHFLYDPDGKGSDDALKFATVQKHRGFDHDDFIVV